MPEGSASVPVDERRVLVFAPRGRDAPLTVEALAKQKVTAIACASIPALCLEIQAGAGAALLTEEAFDPQGLKMLGEVLAQQAAWSDFPFVVLGDAQLDTHPALDKAVQVLGNVTLLERPMRVRAMVAAVKAALRARERQYEGRRAISSRDQFLAMLGHELRNPLAAITMAIELLEHPNGTAEAQTRQRGVIYRQSRHLARLVDDLLDVARVTNGKVVLARERIDLREVVRSVIQAYEHAARSNDVDLEVQLPDGLIVDGDRVRLDQTFGNLLANALKYTPRGGSVKIHGFVANERDVVVKITDSGLGIDAATLPRIFELFAQADHSLDRAQGGMGLGLTLVKSLVQLHGGSVSATSSGPGKGSEFTVTLPLTFPRDAPISSKKTPSAPGVPTQSVAVIDDSPDLRCMVKEVLESAGFDVMTSETGPAGVTQIVEAHPDVAFVDIGLPGFDGYEVARRVRAVLGRDILLVAMTGYGQAEDRQRALDSGFDHHLTKPVSGRDIVALVARSGMQREQAISSR
jgi:signal transduction histidine kinase/ActR/RegA family two-component response regulator